MKHVMTIEVNETQDGRFFAHVTLASGTEIQTDDQRSVRLVLKRAETILQRHPKG